MKHNKLLTLIRSQNIEDTLIGLNILVNTYTKEEMVSFFDKYGQNKKTHPPAFIAKEIKRNIEHYVSSTNQYQLDDYWYKGEIGFFIGKTVRLIDHKKYEEEVKKCTMIFYEVMYEL